MTLKITQTVADGEISRPPFLLLKGEIVMAYEQMLVPVLEKQALAKNIYRMVLQCRSIAQQAACGQFVHLLPVGCTLRRPISICEINKAAGTLTIVFEVKGTGTDALANVRVGENVDILGPMGHGFTILPEAKHVVVVGGGIGNPPMLSLAQVYGERATAICGFRSANIVTLQDEFHASGAETILCTDDGTAGRQDLVTEPLKEQLAKGDVDMVYACGPRPMLKFVAAAAKEYGVRCEVSMEERMGCGIGACLVCACQLEREGKSVMGHVCKDGPVFPAEEVVW